MRSLMITLLLSSGLLLPALAQDAPLRLSPAESQPPPEGPSLQPLPAHPLSIEAPRAPVQAPAPQAQHQQDKRGKSAKKAAATAGESAHVRYRPYAVGRELDLSELEARRFIRSEPVLSPDRTVLAYTEVTYIPHLRQTFSRIFLMPVGSIDTPPESLPSEGPAGDPPRDAAFYQSRLNPDLLVRARRELLAVGADRSRQFDFRTLTIIDWSASGQRLLFKQRSGVLHLGLKVSDILVYDRAGGVVTIYPEIQRILQHYWRTNSNLPDLNTVAWDVYPVGWTPGSDNQVLFKAWAFDQNNRKFLGLWSYDVDAQRASLVTLDDLPATVANNGLVPDFQPILPADAKRQAKVQAKTTTSKTVKPKSLKFRRGRTQPPASSTPSPEQQPVEPTP